MNKIEAFLEKQDKIIREDKEKTLMALGLTEKEYAPDGKESYKYPKYDFVKGERKYYREVAMTVTDEEYALILSKVKKVNDIKEKEALAKQKEKDRLAYRTTKKWIPVFEKPKDDITFSDDKEQVDTGKSKLAKQLRVVFYVLFILALGGAFIINVIEDINLIPIVIGAGIAESIIVEALAGILDYLAELTAIARNGYKYTETSR